MIGYVRACVYLVVPSSRPQGAPRYCDGGELTVALHLTVRGHLQGGGRRGGGGGGRGEGGKGGEGRGKKRRGGGG